MAFGPPPRQAKRVWANDVSTAVPEGISGGEAPLFRVPRMGCRAGHVVVATWRTRSAASCSPSPDDSLESLRACGVGLASAFDRLEGPGSAGHRVLSMEPASGAPLSSIGGCSEARRPLSRVSIPTFREPKRTLPLHRPFDADAVAIWGYHTQPV